MALDTATKRRSMLAMGVLAIVVHPIPDASIDAIDQKHFLGLMAAVATTTVAIVVTFDGKLFSSPLFTGLIISIPKLSGKIYSEPDSTGKFKSH